MPISGCSKKGDYASSAAKQFKGVKAKCELTGAKTYDRLVGYCPINGTVSGGFIMQTRLASSLKSSMFAIAIKKKYEYSKKLKLKYKSLSADLY